MLPAGGRSTPRSPPSGGSNVEYSKRAVSDLLRIAAYYAASDSSPAGEKVADAIRDLVLRISETPLRGRPVVQRPGVRVILLVRYRYKIFYRLAGVTVRIVHVRHMSRRPWPPQ